jgi:hypothetical protein
VSAPNYDRIAKAYRWLEYLMLGPLLERTRNYHLGRVTGCRQALILGDGDGRFTARLLEQNAAMRAEAVDVSGTMLELLAKRARASEGRLRTVQMDAREYVPRERPDLVCTHFFLDCFTQVDVDFGFSHSGWVDEISGAALCSGALLCVSRAHGAADGSVAGLCHAFVASRISAGGGTPLAIWPVDDGTLEA